MNIPVRLDSSSLPRCAYCGMATIPSHGAAACPEVKEVHYYQDGTIKRVVKHDSRSRVTIADGNRGMVRGL